MAGTAAGSGAVASDAAFLGAFFVVGAFFIVSFFKRGFDMGTAAGSGADSKL